MPLVSVELAREYLPGLAPSEDLDDMIEETVARAEAIIGRALGFPGSPEAAELTLTGDQYLVRQSASVLVVILRPLVDVDSVEVDGEAVAFEWDALGRIYGDWPADLRRIEVVAEVGYTDDDGDLVQAVLLQTKHLWDQRAEGVRPNVSAQGTSIGRQTRGIPEEVAELIAPLRPMHWSAA